MVPLESQDTFSQDLQQLMNLKLEILGECKTIDKYSKISAFVTDVLYSYSAHQEPLVLSKSMAQFVTYPEKDTLGMDNVYMINLLRRPERRKRMNHCFNELGILAETLDAVDGK